MPTGLGAKITLCCRLASLLDVPMIQAAQTVVPVAVTAAEVGNGDGSDFCCGAVHGRDWNSLPSPIIPAIATPLPIQYHQIPSTITVGGSSSTLKKGQPGQRRFLKDF
jgi:hypothetical protein